jgi:hypothetical protein
VWCKVYREICGEEYEVTADDDRVADETPQRIYASPANAKLSLGDAEKRMRRFLTDWRDEIFNRKGGAYGDASAMAQRPPPTFTVFGRRIDRLGGWSRATPIRKAAETPKRTPYPPAKRDREAVFADRAARGRALKERRVRLGLSRVAFAAQANLPKSAVDSAEHGWAAEKSIARVEEALRAAEARRP